MVSNFSDLRDFWDSKILGTIRNCELFQKRYLGFGVIIDTTVQIRITVMNGSS